MKNLANNNAKALKKAGISPQDIERMKQGYVPRDFDVHHKDPLNLGGDNSLDNLILMQNKNSGKVNYHGALTNYQNSLTRDILPGETFQTMWPKFNGLIYP